MTERTHARLAIAEARLRKHPDHDDLRTEIGRLLDSRKRREDGVTVFDGTEQDAPFVLDLLARAEAVVGSTERLRPSEDGVMDDHVGFEYVPPHRR